MKLKLVLLTFAFLCHITNDPHNPPNRWALLSGSVLFTFRYFGYRLALTMICLLSLFIFGREVPVVKRAKGVSLRPHFTPWLLTDLVSGHGERHFQC